jgi:hypothetical protein
MAGAHGVVGTEQVSHSCKMAACLSLFLSLSLPFSPLPLFLCLSPLFAFLVSRFTQFQ